MIKNDPKNIQYPKIDLVLILPYLISALINRIRYRWEYDESIKAFIKDPILHAAYARGRLFMSKKELNEARYAYAGNNNYKEFLTDKGGECCEEIRYMLLHLIHIILLNSFTNCTSSLLNAYIYDMILFTIDGIYDKYPECNLKSCQILSLLAQQLISIMKHFSVASIKSVKCLLYHRYHKIRIEALRTIKYLVLCPNYEKQRGSGSEAILDLVAFQEENIVPIGCFYGIEDPKINLFALLDQDPQIAVRKEFYRTLAEWLLRLPDKYDYESRLIPYLLSAVMDDIEEISTEALTILDEAGLQYEKDHFSEIIEKKQYAIDGDKRCNYDKPLPKPFKIRPPLSTRLFVRSRCQRFIKTLLNELKSWACQTKIKASRLLKCTIVFCEEQITFDIYQMIETLVQCWSDNVIHQDIEEITDLVGRFVHPSAYLDLIVPYITGEEKDFDMRKGNPLVHEYVHVKSANDKAYILEMLLVVIKGSKIKEISAYFTLLVDICNKPSIIDSPMPRLQLSRTKLLNYLNECIGRG